MVSPLLRLENNHCHIEESEYVLKKAHKYSELIILYEKKGLHQKGEAPLQWATRVFYVSELTLWLHEPVFKFVLL